MTLRLAACSTAMLVVLAAPAHAVTYFGQVIASNLNNPRGLAFGPDGGLYIAEAGTLSPSGPETVIRGATYRYSPTGSITQLLGGVQTRIVTGLPSIAQINGTDQTGPSDIVFGAGGQGYVVVGLGGDPALRSGVFAPGAGLGQLHSFTLGGATSIVADLAGVEGALNPAGGALDSNPFHIVRNGAGFLVTDAGSNTLLTVSSSGTPALLATFPARFIGPPPPLSDSVPTGVAVGPDGNFYVAELTGFPFTQGAAQIYRVTPGGNVSVAYTGFTNLTDIAFGADGLLYALQLDTNGLTTPGGTGSLIRVLADGTQETLFTEGLVTPTGLEIGADGAFYVTNFSAVPGQGQVLRIAAVPEPASWAMMIAGFGAVGAMARRRTRLAPAAAAG